MCIGSECWALIGEGGGVIGMHTALVILVAKFIVVKKNESGSVVRTEGLVLYDRGVLSFSC